jgi:hypothetical protein
MLVAMYVDPKDAILARGNDYGWAGLEVDLKKLTVERREALAEFPRVPGDHDDCKLNPGEFTNHIYSFRSGTPLVKVPGNVSVDFSALCRALDWKQEQQEKAYENWNQIQQGWKKTQPKEKKL